MRRALKRGRAEDAAVSAGAEGEEKGRGRGQGAQEHWRRKQEQADNNNKKKQKRVRSLALRDGDPGKAQQEQEGAAAEEGQATAAGALRAALAPDDALVEGQQVQEQEQDNTELRFRGAAQFRWRVVCAALSGRALRIEDIRADDEAPGVRDSEAAFLHLVREVTNGSDVYINDTGTLVRFRPGVITGGRVRHDCGGERAIGWFLEGILPLLVFGKAPAQLELRGLTNMAGRDMSVDTMQNLTTELLARFGVQGAQLRIVRRGAPPAGGGVVQFTCPVVRSLTPLDMLDVGLVNRVRGVAYCTRVSPQVANRLVSGARAVLAPFVKDVYIYTDHYKAKREGGESPGFALNLVAETTSGARLAAEATAVAQSAAQSGAARGAGGAGGGGVSIPEEVGAEAAARLLEEVSHEGCVDSAHQCLLLLFMALCPEDACRAHIGTVLTPAATAMLRLIRTVFGVVFRIKQEATAREGEGGGAGGLRVSCLGSGFKNFSKKVT